VHQFLLWALVHSKNWLSVSEVEPWKVRDGIPSVAKVNTSIDLGANKVSENVRLSCRVHQFLLWALVHNKNWLSVSEVEP